jgi:hypothetical protein
MKHDPKLFEVHEQFKKHLPHGQLGHCHLYNKSKNVYITLHMRVCSSCGAFYGFYEDYIYTHAASHWEPLYKFMAMDEGRIHEAILSTRDRRINAVYEQYKLAVAAGGYKEAT